MHFMLFCFLVFSTVASCRLPRQMPHLSPYFKVFKDKEQCFLKDLKSGTWELCLTNLFGVHNTTACDSELGILY